MQNERVLIFTATLNERKNIEALCQKILSLSPQYELLVVDDNSPDGTGRVLRELQAHEPRLHSIHRRGRLGLGTAHKLAMVFAMQNDYDILVTMDADWSHNPDDIPRLVEKLKDKDFVTGSRYMKGGACDYHGYRKFVSVAANTAARIILTVPLHEFTTSFRAYRVSFLRKFNFGKVQARGYSFFLEIAYRIAQQGGRVGEIPIHFADRKHGVSKIPQLEIFRGIYRLLSLTLSRFSPVNRKALILPELKTLKCGQCRSPYLIEVQSEATCLECGHDFDPVPLCQTPILEKPGLG